MSAQGPGPLPDAKKDVYPTTALAIDVSSTDANLATSFGMGYARALYVGVTGDVSAQLVDDAAAVVYKNVPQGTYLVGFFTKVTHAGTTATNIVAVA